MSSGETTDNLIKDSNSIETSQINDFPQKLENQDGEINNIPISMRTINDVLIENKDENNVDKSEYFQENSSTSTSFHVLNGINAIKHVHHLENELNDLSTDSTVGALKTPLLFSPQPKFIPSKENLNIIIDTDFESEKQIEQNNPILYKNLTQSVDTISHNIQLLSYNLFLRPPPTRTNYNNGNGDYKDQRLGCFLNPKINPLIESFDIISLQEIFGFLNRRKDYCIQQASQLGFKYYTTIASHWMSLKPIDSGLLILSKYPIVDTDQHIFSKGTHVDGWTTKGSLFARILLPNNTHLLLFNAHLQADYNGNDPLYWQIQQHQIYELRDFIDKKIELFPEDQVIIMADMNVDSRHHRGDDNTELKDDEHSDVYIEMMNILNSNKSQIKFHDLLFEQNNNHPITYGYAENVNGQYKPFETILTNPKAVSVRHSIDYIFLGRKADNKYNTTVSPNSSKFEPFFVQDKEFTQLSDHYGVRTRLVISS